MSKILVDRKLLEQAREALACAYISNASLDELSKALAGPDVTPAAWMTFDGEGGYDLRLYDMNESYRNDYIKRNGAKYERWVELLYALPPSQPVVQHLPADDTEGGAL